MEKAKIVIEFAPSITTQRHIEMHKEEIIKEIEAILEESKLFQKCEYSVYFTWR